MGPTWAPQACWARPVSLWLTGAPPWGVFSANISQILQKKSYKIFKAFGELLFFGHFFIARIIQKIVK
jgi:hypothetical protein